MEKALPISKRIPSQPTGPSRRLFAYCHEGMGIGHLRRTLTICNRLVHTFPRLERRIATGSPYVSLFETNRQAGWVKLPTLVKRCDGRYRPAVRGLTLNKLIDTRRQLLLAAVRRFDPHLLLVDKAPVGVCGELAPTLRWVREHRPHTRIIFGMRDIEDEPHATVSQWMRLDAQRMLEECYDELWVYGMREVFDVARMYRFSPCIARKIDYMGYVCEPAGDTSRIVPADADQILVTVGGGTDGENLIRAYLDEAARRLAGIGLRSTIIAGPDLPREAARCLRQIAGRIDSLQWIDAEHEMRHRLHQARLVVSMGGYNTLCELVSLGRPALVVPRVTPRLEQLMRASLWHKRGVIHMLHPDDLTPHTLADHVLDMSRDKLLPTRDGLDFNGLNRVVDRVGHLFNTTRKRHEAAVRL